MVSRRCTSRNASRPRERRNHYICKVWTPNSHDLYEFGTQRINDAKCFSQGPNLSVFESNLDLRSSKACKTILFINFQGFVGVGPCKTIGPIIAKQALATQGGVGEVLLLQFAAFRPWRNHGCIPIRSVPTFAKPWFRAVSSLGAS